MTTTRGPLTDDKARQDCVLSDVCPECQEGRTNEGWQCDRCGFDAWPEWFYGGGVAAGPPSSLPPPFPLQRQQEGGRGANGQ